MLTIRRMATMARVLLASMLINGTRSTGDLDTGLDELDVTDYCEDETFRASCDDGHVVVMTHAVYGRMRIGRCLTSEYSYIAMGCEVDVRSYIDTWCSGRSSCEVLVSSLMHAGPKPCPKDFRSYMEAAYTCVPVLRPASSPCARNDPILVSQPSGYLASMVTMETGCGSFDSPWLIKAEAGQRINITLWDFSTMTHRRPQKASSLPVCLVYAIVKETDGVAPTRTVCGGKSRLSTVYTSVGNSVEVRLVINRKKQGSSLHFLMQYEVVGCANPTLPIGHWFERDYASAVAGCDNSDETWHITCNGNTWIGKIGNCSRAASSSRSTWSGLFKFSNMSQAVSILIITCVAIFVGFTVLLIGIIYLRRHFERQAPQPSDRHDYNLDLLEVATYQPAGKSSDACGDSGSNTYYRTWQLQQQQQQQQHLLPHSAQASIPTFHDSGAPSSTTTGNYKQPSVTCSEHVYESPTFERHGDGSICGNRDEDPSMRGKYFVLDPDTVSSRTGEDASAGIHFRPAD